MAWPTTAWLGGTQARARARTDAELADRMEAVADDAIRLGHLPIASLIFEMAQKVRVVAAAAAASKDADDRNRQA